MKVLLALLVPLESSITRSRRQLISSLLSTSFSLVAGPSESLELRDLTKLAPLGGPEKYPKTRNLSLTELADRLTSDLSHGAAGQGGYIVSGDLSTDIFLDDCTFVDPNNRVNSLSQYKRALSILFDPKQSCIQLLGPLKVDETARTISGRFRSRGFLQLPWKPYVTAYEADIVYKVGDDGLIYEQSQEWTKSVDQALRETFTPTLFTPPPASSIPRPDSEPLEVTSVFQFVNGRRKDEYSAEERKEIDSLIQSIVDRRYKWQPQLFPGKWILVYLQPGPDGATIDRRIPFPEFSFNDNYQSFTTDSVLNVGELFGPSVDVRVFGSITPVSEDSQVPKRFRADITGGKLCWRPNCIDLPITGEGLFDSVYLGERLRIGQNLNGGGARVVQVRLE